jgi:hypothetical protein
MNDVVARYLDCWNETDPAARRKLIDEVWAAAAEYTDPLVHARGRAQIDAVMASVQAQFPGLRFTQSGSADAHHQQARFGWALAAEGAEPLVEGFDVVVFDDDNQIETVLGFLDRMPG